MLAQEAGLQLTFNEADQDYDIFVRNEELRVVELPWTSIQSLRAKHGFLEDQLLIDLLPGTALENLPGVSKKRGELRLKILKTKRVALDALVVEMEDYRAGRKTDIDIDDALDDIQDFLERY